MKFRLLFVLASLFLASCDRKTEPPTARVQRLIVQKLGAGAQVSSIKSAGVADLFEVVADGNVFYVDRDADHLVVGHIINGKTFRDLTMKRLDEIHTVDFATLPLKSALKQVTGTGKRVVVVFEDPNCEYCKKFRAAELQKIDDVTVYTFLYPLLSADSEAKSRAIWCSPNPNVALRDWAVSGVIPPPASASCNDPVTEVKALGRKLHVNGTPAFYFADGSRILGATSSRIVEERLSTISDKK